MGEQPELPSDRSDFVRAVVVGNDRVGVTKASAEAASSRGGVQAHVQGLLQPPYDPEQMWGLLEHSNSLRQNVDSYSTNIDGFGHGFDPVLDLDKDDSEAKVRDAMAIEEIVSGGGSKKPKELSDAEVTKRIGELRVEQRIQRFRAEMFFQNVVLDESFVALRRKTRFDLELTGNGYWEVIRGAGGAIDQFVHMPAQAVRLLPRESTVVEVEQLIDAGPLSFQKQKVKRRFRRFVQFGEAGEAIWFKEFGDPRTLSSKTGKFFKDEAALAAASDDGGKPATEVVHFRIYSSTSAYGVPRWIGNILSVLGSRQAEEVNYLYFNNKSVPPLAITVSGGRLTSDAVARIESYVETELKGKKNFHKILILEAESPSAAGQLGLDNNGRCKIEIKALTEAHLSDALFQNYDQANIDKVGMSFRLPRLLRGDVRDFNRATAEAALDFAETQVFAPERNEFDYWINRVVMPLIGVRHWRFRSNGVQLRDPKSVSGMIKEIALVGGLTPADARRLAGELVFNRDLGKIDAEWAQQPLSLANVSPEEPEEDGVELDAVEEAGAALAEAKSPKKPGSAKKKPVKPGADEAAAKAALVRGVRKLMRLRKVYEEAEEAEARSRHAAAQAETDPAPPAPEPKAETGVTVLKMAAADMKSKLGVEPLR